ncbi:MAG: hypothetical protein CSA62_06110 [Planctomycetota bacterium]|nr:MAG: hypothetical protein CSA62_06110 [Planctomycetota bacterium]
MNDSCDLLSQWLERFHSGDRDFAAFCASHPEQRQELERLWQRLIESGEVDPGLEPKPSESLASLHSISSGSQAPCFDEETGLPEEDSAFGHYRILRELGRGAQGTVFLAEDQRFDRKVALKVQPLWRLHRSEHKKRFAREAELASRLQHPAICRVYERGLFAGTAFLAMEYVEGRSLAQRIAKQRQALAKGGSPQVLSLPELGKPRSQADSIRRLLEFFDSIAAALSAAHQAGLIHRDIKPGNIMVSPDARPVLLDFGLARAVEEEALTMTGDLIGTPAYMSPEQLMAQRIELDQRSDIYSLGATIFECLTLHRPFEAATRQELYQQILTSPAPDIRAFGKALPRDLAVVVATTLEKDRRRRYQSAADLAEDLRRIRIDSPIRVRPAGPLRKLVDWAKRNPVVATSAALIFVILSLALTVTLSMTFELLSARDSLGRATLGPQIEKANRQAEELLDLDSPGERHSPKRVTALRRWDEIYGRPLQKARPDIAARLSDLRAEAYEEDESSLARFRAEHPLQDEIRRLQQQLVGYDRGLVEARRELAERFLEVATARYRNQLAELEAKLAKARPWRMRTPAMQVTHDSLAQLLRQLDAFCGKKGMLQQIRRELQFVASRQQAQQSRAFRQSWAEAAARLKEDPRFGGLDLIPQFGLQPLGPDPDSALEEFAVLASGTPPTRDAGGHIQVKDDSAIVLVLVPGASYALGSRQPRPKKLEVMIKAVELAPFLISKYEMTRSQWQRIGGEEDPHGLTLEQLMNAAQPSPRHPIAAIEWAEARKQLRRHGLELPSVTQWEYAARGGTNERLPHGSGNRGPAPYNIRDRSFILNPRPQMKYDDGHALTAAVGSFLPNGFGLFDVVGNLSEWCRESSYPVPFDYFARDADDAYYHIPQGESFSVRGGSYTTQLRAAYLGARRQRSTGQELRDVGIRAIRQLERDS